jgi:hypothetical protein
MTVTRGSMLGEDAPKSKAGRRAVSIKAEDCYEAPKAIWVHAEHSDFSMTASYAHVAVYDEHELVGALASTSRASRPASPDRKHDRSREKTGECGEQPGIYLAAPPFLSGDTGVIDGYRYPVRYHRSPEERGERVA